MGKKKAPTKVVDTVRQCANIKSRKHPDIQCQLSATQGEFCSRHAKNPTRFQEAFVLDSSKRLEKQQSAELIQRAWRTLCPLLRWKRQGPATNAPELAENETDIYTLESVKTIPAMYRWSYTDSKRHIWIFDIRSLSMTRAEDSREGLLNPYTREKLSAPAEQSFQNRCAFLRARKYCLVHSSDAELTAEQLWHQRVLDVVLKYDMLGYHTCISWFEDLQPATLALFYTELFDLWNYRLQLSAHIKNQVVPGWSKPESLLFKWRPEEVRNRRDRVWWKKTLLELLDRLVSAGQAKETRILGALYGMTAFAIVSPTVRHAYPWLVEMPEEY